MTTSWIWVPGFANWSASCRLGFLTYSIHLLYSVDICTVGPHQFMAAKCQPIYEISDDDDEITRFLIFANETKAQTKRELLRISGLPLAIFSVPLWEVLPCSHRISSDANIWIEQFDLYCP